MGNIEIQFNAAVIKKVKSLNFQVDQLGSILFILFSLYEGNTELLDEFDDFNLQKRAILLYKEMENRGLISQNTDDEKGSPHFSLSNEGTELVEFIKGEFTAKAIPAITSEDIAILGVETLKDAVAADDVEVWIDKWLDIFPRGVKSSGRLIRSDKPSCIRKMKVFLREYPYTVDTIMQATEKYISSKREENFMYTRCAVYFIYRIGTSNADKVSDLASWCDQVLHENTEPKRENNLDIMA